MANSINYAESYSSELLDITNQQTLTSPFITSNVKWLTAKTFHRKALIPSGFKTHSRAGGWNKGEVAETDVTFTLEHDRDISFNIDKADVDESNMTATVENTSIAMQADNQAPEVDARFFERVSQAAIAADAADADKTYVDVVSKITADNVVSTIKTAISHVKIYRGSLMVYVNTAVMNLLETAMYEKGRTNWTSVGEGPNAVETRIFMLDGTPIVEVLDDTRFGTSFVYYGDGDEDYGFDLATDDRGLQICVASLKTVNTVPKISSIYFFRPGEHTEGDGYLYQNRQYWDTFVYPNGKKNAKVDSVAIVVAK